MVGIGGSGSIRWDGMGSDFQIPCSTEQLRYLFVPAVRSCEWEKEVSPLGGQIAYSSEICVSAKGASFVAMGVQSLNLDLAKDGQGTSQ